MASSHKRIVFRFVTLAFPLVVLAGIESALRAFGYGDDLKLITERVIGGKKYYTLNREFPRRYSSQKGIPVPEAYDDLFEAVKQEKTKRVFCLGESTMAGFPFDYNATPPRLLADRLRRLLPQYNIEVVNVGLSAVNSYTVRDVISELVEYQPDAFVIYLGHNEFYSALGIGSTEFLGQIQWLINSYLKLQRFRIFLLLRDAISSIRNLFVRPPAPRDATLMGT